MFNKRTGLAASFVALATAAGFAVSPAQAKTQHHYRSTIRSTAVLTSNGYPKPGGKAVLAGTWDTDLFGAGALVDHVTITGQHSTTFEFKGTEVSYSARGTLRDVFTGTAVVQPDGSQTLTAKCTFTGGTGAYKGATGHCALTGTVAPGSQVLVARSSGTLSY